MDIKAYLLQGEQTRQSIETNAKNARSIFAGLRTMTAALKKGCSDMTSALNTVKVAAALQERAAASGQSASSRAAAKAAKAKKLPSYAATNDPSCIKIHKILTKDREIARATSWDALKTNKDARDPFILRCLDALA